MVFLVGLCFDLVCFGFVCGCTLALRRLIFLCISLLFCVVQFSFLLQDSVLAEDKETTPEEPRVVETTFGVVG